MPILIGAIIPKKTSMLWNSYNKLIIERLNLRCQRINGIRMSFLSLLLLGEWSDEQLQWIKPAKYALIQ